MHEGIVHKNVNVEIFFWYFDMVLPAHKGEACTHFDEKLLDMFYKAQFNISFVVLFGERKHIKNIGVF